MKYASFFLMVVMFWSCKQKSESETGFSVSEGVTKDLAIARKSQVSNLFYDLKFHIPKHIADSIYASETISCQLDNLNHPLILDFKEATSKILDVSVNQSPTEIQHKNGHIIIDARYLKLGDNTITINFIAGELSLNRNDDYLYTLLVPDRASTLFPCFDQPDLKAMYNLEISAPTSWKVLAGAPLKSVEARNSVATHVFETSDKMSTYLFSFVAGKFNVVQDEVNGVKMRMLYRENDEAKIKESVPEIFRLHREAITFLEDYTNCPFPFKKLDFATIPGFQYGGMEHVGAIQYRESSLFLDETATEDQLLNRGKLIAHETAHMWFGNLVTMTWFSDVWLKEVFANFMADKIANPSFPDVNHELQFLTEHYSSAYSVDRTKGSNPIRQDLDNLKDAGTLYGTIIYDKAPIMMRQLEAILGENRFRTGLQEYIKTYKISNADWRDLIDILDKKTSVNLKAWSDVWVNKSGRAIFKSDITYGKNNQISAFRLSQKAEDGSDKFWPQTFQMGLVYPDSVYVVNTTMTGEKQPLKGVEGLGKPERIIYNYDGFGYGVFPVQNPITSILDIGDDVARTYAYINLFENTLNAKVAPLEALNVFEKAVLSEKNEAVVKLISSQLNSVFWTYLTEAQRQSKVNALEKGIRSRILQNLPEGLKKTLFNVYIGIAYNKAGKDFLYRVWHGDVTIPNLKLNENDYIRLAATLALYKHNKAGEILKVAQTQIKNSDRQKRFVYLQPALSDSVSIRDDYFKGLAKEKNRSKESWVLSGLYYLNHPLRQKESQKYLKQSLDLLEEVQVTGDIFFPIGWVNNTIGMYNSAFAKEQVDRFLLEHPDYSPPLRLKLLQAADPIFRAQHIFNSEQQ